MNFFTDRFYFKIIPQLSYAVHTPGLSENNLFKNFNSRSYQFFSLKYKYSKYNENLIFP